MGYSPQTPVATRRSRTNSSPRLSLYFTLQLSHLLLQCSISHLHLYLSLRQHVESNPEKSYTPVLIHSSFSLVGKPALKCPYHKPENNESQGCAWLQTVNNAKENYDLSAMNLDTFLGGLRSPTG